MMKQAKQNNKGHLIPSRNTMWVAAASVAICVAVAVKVRVNWLHANHTTAAVLEDAAAAAAGLKHAAATLKVREEEAAEQKIIDSTLIELKQRYDSDAASDEVLRQTAVEGTSNSIRAKMAAERYYKQSYINETEIDDILLNVTNYAHRKQIIQSYTMHTFISYSILSNFLVLIRDTIPKDAKTFYSTIWKSSSNEVKVHDAIVGIMKDLRLGYYPDVFKHLQREPAPPT